MEKTGNNNRIKGQVNNFGHKPKKDKTATKSSMYK